MMDNTSPPETNIRRRISRTMIDNAAADNACLLLTSAIKYRTQLGHPRFLLCVHLRSRIEDKWEECKCIAEDGLIDDESGAIIAPPFVPRVPCALQFADKRHCLGFVVMSETEDIECAIHFVSPQILFADWSSFTEGQVLQKLLKISPSSMPALWGRASTVLRDEFEGFTTDFFHAFGFAQCHIDQVIALSRKHGFYCEKIAALANSGSASGVVFCFETPEHPLFAFAFYRVCKHAPVARRSACLLEIQYMLTDLPRRQIGTQLLHMCVRVAQDRFPGRDVMVEIESKRSQAAEKFWFDSGRFVRYPAEGDSGVVSGSNRYPPSHLLEILEVQDDVGEQMLSLFDDNLELVSP